MKSLAVALTLLAMTFAPFAAAAQQQPTEAEHERIRQWVSPQCCVTSNALPRGTVAHPVIGPSYSAWVAYAEMGLGALLVGGLGFI